MDKQIEILTQLPEYLSTLIKGQDHIMPRICSVLRRGELGLNPPEKPKGSFLFLGPTGVGKTETAKAFTQRVFGPDKLFTFDMSEFQHQDGVKLFLGNDTGSFGRIGRVLNEHTTGTLLFDEIEKAHPLILDLFLQILDAARITTGDGKTHDLSGFYIVLTSNIGGEEIMHLTHQNLAAIERIVLDLLYDFVRPEFKARIQEICVFQKLTHEVQREIADDKLALAIKRLGSSGYNLEPSSDAIEFLIRKGISRSEGARPLVGTIEKYTGDAISEARIAGTNTSGSLVLNPTGTALVIS